MTDTQVLQERKKIAEQLRGLRIEHGYSQKEVADAMGITHDTISKIEAGKWNFGIDTVIKYTGVFKSKPKFV
jgi:transcriptional regulator with XRE-family HTH domain